MCLLQCLIFHLKSPLICKEYLFCDHLARRKGKEWDFEKFRLTDEIL